MAGSVASVDVIFCVCARRVSLHVLTSVAAGLNSRSILLKGDLDTFS